MRALALALLAAGASATPFDDSHKHCPGVAQDHLMLQTRRTTVRGRDEPEPPKCCFSFADPSSPCASCLSGAYADGRSWCGSSRANCKTCKADAAWCEGDSEATPPTPGGHDPAPTTTTRTSATTPATTSTAWAAPTPPPGSWIRGTWTTGYWDCCKPSCAWAGKGHVSKPVLSCDIETGEKLFDPNVGSVCNGGRAASCTDNKPFVVRPRLSMGFAAAAVSGSSGLSGDENCGQCFELRFVDRRHSAGWGGAHPGLVGKAMVVQVTNIGFDVTGSHSFDIQIPAAGQGIFTNGCTSQFSGYSSADFDCANNYGGCREKSDCARLPEALRSGCEWRHDWYHWMEGGGQTNNPFVDFRRVRCPERLTNISWSIPVDDHLYEEVDIESYA